MAHRHGRRRAALAAGLMAAFTGVAAAGEGRFEVNGTGGELSGLAVLEVGDRYSPGVHQLNLTLHSAGVSVGKYAPSGSGNAVVLKLHGGAGSLEPGRYEFRAALEPEPGTFSGITVYRGHDFASGEGAQYGILGGSVELQKSGRKREIDFTLEVSPTGAAGTGTVEGRYSGAVDARYAL